jgi:hypothetical protein
VRDFFPTRATGFEQGPLWKRTVFRSSRPKQVFPSSRRQRKLNRDWNSILCLPRIPSVSQRASLWHANRRFRRYVLVSLLASTSKSKDWQSLPRPVVECIQVQGVRAAKEFCLGSAKVWSGRSRRSSISLRKANVDATGLLRLSGASQVAVV